METTYAESGLSGQSGNCMDLFNSTYGDIASQMQFWAEKCCQAAGVTTYARVDELLDKNNNIFCLEINTLPGMTDTSLIPQEAAAVGISYDELTEKIIEISLAKYE